MTTEQPSLFGGTSPIDHKSGRSSYADWKKSVNYRLAEDKTKSCKACDFCYRKRMSKNYYKCKFMGFSSSPASDIRLRDTCDKFKPQSEEEVKEDDSIKRSADRPIKK